MSLLIGGLAYGAVGRQLVGSLSSKLPINQSLGNGVIDYLIAKNTSGVIRDTALAGLAVEAAGMGGSLLSGGMSALFGGASSTATTTQVANW